MAYNPNFRGSTAKASSRQVGTNYQNGTLSTMNVATPVSTNNSSQLIVLDPSNETSVENFLGYTAGAIPSSASGQVVNGGRLENVGATLSFAVGTPLWVNFDGTLTSTKPDLSVSGWASGDFVIFVGVVVQNEFDNTKKDLQLMTQLIGQL